MSLAAESHGSKLSGSDSILMRTTVLSVSSADTPNGIDVTAILMVNANAAVLPVFFIFQFPLCAAYTKVCHGGTADSGQRLYARCHNFIVEDFFLFVQSFFSLFCSKRDTFYLISFLPCSIIGLSAVTQRIKFLR